MRRRRKRRRRCCCCGDEVGDGEDDEFLCGGE